ncbi:NAD(P)-binding protein [Niveibacterium microcysteis]|uniref:NAD(P)-binding protein n=1 Tax=Niveibacterium microcysteis TaxID=2811415 RepID=A0ABX7MBA9_9RHOO|nr:NAD(P)-binding protein [Niveibacterium microcysteis]QSI79012.1 NAD(P)-binding protein [Niveibacterium microcysteis]
MDKPFAITLDPGSSLANHTGSWRTARPSYVDHLPPCNQGCPTGENIQGWLYHAESGQYEAAWRVLVQDNPMPAVTGRVCYHPCEGACNRARLDSAVSIHAVERFLGDEAIKQDWQFARPPALSGKRVLVVGAGPSGLAAAYHLARLGHAVEVREAGPMAGGMMRFGIPKYRLPRDVLDAEIRRIEQLGVTIRLNTKVDHLLKARDEGGFDAAFVAVGAHVSKRAWVPAGEAARIMDALSVLRSVELGEKPLLGRRVLVYGGGNTAIDVARTARRLGAEEAVIIYRRTRDRMPAHDSEVQEALDEGVMFRWLSTIKMGADAGAREQFTIEKMALDESGFPQPTGEFEQIEADSLVLALGQDVDLSLLDDVPGLQLTDGVVGVGSNMMTACPGIFAGGDMVPAERTVTVALGHGKKAARHIDAWLRGEAPDVPEKHPVAPFERLNTWYYTDAPRSVQQELERVRRESTFDEVVSGLNADTALFEARRCLSCGNCFECDNCYGVCPDNAVIKLGPGKRFKINLDYCKGCGLCAAECPCGAIEMVPETI